MQSSRLSIWNPGLAILTYRASKTAHSEEVKEEQKKVDEERLRQRNWIIKYNQRINLIRISILAAILRSLDDPAKR
jgi:hypothetical protein